MSYIGGSTCATKVPPLRFHQIREGETAEGIADKYRVDLGSLLKENPGVDLQPGEVIVINLRESKLA
jgi:LysM repeat protein